MVGGACSKGGKDGHKVPVEHTGKILATELFFKVIFVLYRKGEILQRE